MRRFETELLTIWFWMIPAMASGAVTLPLQGYCKPGRYFPVQVDGSDCAQNITFSAGTSLRSSMEPQAGSSVIVPLLAGDAAHELAWQYKSLPLRNPETNERLIAGLNAEEIAAAATLFPGKRLLPIPLDPTNLFPGPPVAWETLDGIILNQNVFPRVTAAQRSSLLASGVILISIGNSPPDVLWPWRQSGPLWLLSATLSGPAVGLVNENVYAPTFSWIPDWPGSIREQVVGIAALIVLLTIALSLRPTRTTAWITTLFLILSAAGIISWRHALGTVDSAGGDILVAANGLVQRDTYLYQRAGEAGTQIVPWTGSTRPIFPSQTGMNQANLQLHLSSAGQLHFTYNVQPGHTMTFLRRDVQPGDLPAAEPSFDSPMLDLAKLEYLQGNDFITGSLPAPAGRWPGVEIQHH